MRKLKDSNAVVVGGGSGIGRGVALALARRGANVLVADLRASAAESVARAIMSSGGRAFSIETNVVEPQHVDLLGEAADARFPSVDLLVNSPGLSLARRLEDATEADWRRLMDVNFFGVVRCCRAFIPRMKAQGGGHIVNNASIAALVAQDVPGLGLYSASKHALFAYSRTLAYEERESGLRVSLVACGRVATNLGANSLDYVVSTDTGRALTHHPEPTDPGTAMPADEAGEIIVRGIEEGRFLIFTHADRRDQVAAEHRALLDEIDAQCPRT